MKYSKKETVQFPIPLKINGTDEFGPCPQTMEQKQVEARLTGLSGILGKKHGVTRREFLRTASGMAAAFIAMNSVFGNLFSVESAEASDPAFAQERAAVFKGQFIFDVQTHFVSNDYTGRGLLSLRRLASRWNPAIRGEGESLQNIHYRNFVKEVFEESDTKIALRSNAPAEAFRRIEIPEDLQKKFSFSPLGPADGKVKNMVFGRNAARLYGVKVNETNGYVKSPGGQLK